jgi:nucleoside-diphosphate-sugar epimerase
MNILVTGSSGFIGSYLSKKLEVLGHNVLCFSHLDGDIQNFNFNRKYKNIEIDLIYHLAGKTFVPDS